MTAIWDAIGFLFAAFWLGAFAFWLFGYFAVEVFKHLASGPSPQFRSLGTTVLDEPTGKIPNQTIQSGSTTDEPHKAA